MDSIPDRLDIAIRDLTDQFPDAVISIRCQHCNRKFVNTGEWFQHMEDAHPEENAIGDAWPQDGE